MSASKATRYELTQEGFDRLLRWLDADRDRAGEKYELIRLQLIKIFMSRGCEISQELADETINRVAKRVLEISETYQGNPAHYFYGVARLVYLEYARRKVPHILPAPPPVSSDEEEARYQCLSACLERLPPASRRLIEAYYGDEERGCEERRRVLAQEFGLQPNALWVRAHRIREKLRDCVSQCMARRQR